MERVIMLSLEKAKEFYEKGGEFRDLALGAYTEEELTKVELPKTWEEFCEKYPVKKGESYLKTTDEIGVVACDLTNRGRKSWIPSKKSAEAHLAMIQLEQLRDCYRQGWKPNYGDDMVKHYIYVANGMVCSAHCYSESKMNKRRRNLYGISQTSS